MTLRQKYLDTVKENNELRRALGSANDQARVEREGFKRVIADLEARCAHLAAPVHYPKNNIGPTKAYFKKSKRRKAGKKR